jgi:hypothetical protein
VPRTAGKASLEVVYVRFSVWIRTALFHMRRTDQTSRAPPSIARV